MKHLLLVIALALSATLAYADETEIPEWDVGRMKTEARQRGWTWQPRESWVTTFLKNGGHVEQITGLKKARSFAKALGESWDEVKDVPFPIPARFNWGEYSAKGLQPIRNQASCGSCWAFSVTAVLEGLIKLHYPESDPDLAEQTLVSTCERSGSCSGGFFNAFDYVQSPGLPIEADDPYRARNSSCKAGLKTAGKVERWSYIGKSGQMPTTEQIKAAILLYGPVSVDVNGNFGSYGSGIYNKCSRGGVNHMVNLEGWDDDGEYWIMRNSWGTGWGEDGYMRIKWVDSQGRKCNRIGEVAAYAVLDKTSLRADAKRYNWGQEELFRVPAKSL